MELLAPSKLRVVFLFWRKPGFGGAERRYIRLASYLAKARMDVEVLIVSHVACVEGIYDILEKESLLLVESFGSRGPVDGFANVATSLFDLRRLLRSLAVSHLHLCASPSFVSALTALAAPPLVKFSLGFFDSIYTQRVGRVGRVSARWSLARFSRIECLSPGLGRVCSRIFRAHRHKIEVTPCSFIDYSKVGSSHDRDIDVVMMARFSVEKGYDLVEQVADRLTGLSLHLCGFGSRTPRCQGPNIKVYRADNPFEILGRAKIFLSLQKADNYPSQSLMEAMASGCAIIATDVGETRRLLDESCALLIPYDSEVLAESVIKLMEDDDLREKLSVAARIRVTERHPQHGYPTFFLKRILRIK